MAASSAIDAVRRVPMFAGLSDADAALLVRALRPRALAQGEALFRQGDPGDTLVVVASGALSVDVRRLDGGEAPVAVIAEGEVVGEMACVDPHARSASVLAKCDTVVYELHRDALDALRAQAPSVAAAVVGAVIRDVTRRLRDVNAVIEAELGGGSGVPSVHGGLRAAPPSSGAPPTVREPQSQRGGAFRRLVDRLRGLG
jgi:CRP/FNR family transcriptional regulator